MATQLLGYVSRNVDNVIIGQRFGAGPLGVYSRAYQLLLLPLNQLNAPSTTRGAAAAVAEPLGQGALQPPAAARPVDRR